MPVLEVYNNKKLCPGEKTSDTHCAAQSLCQSALEVNWPNETVPLRL